MKRKIASLKAFYTYLEEQELIEESPMRRIRTRFKEERILPRIIPRREIEKLLNVMYRQLKSGKGKKTILRDLAVVEMFFATGARVYEVANIKIEKYGSFVWNHTFYGKRRKGTDDTDWQPGSDCTFETVLYGKQGSDPEVRLFFCKSEWKPLFGAVDPENVKTIYKKSRNREEYYTTYVPALVCNLSDRRGRGCELCAADFGA